MLESLTICEKGGLVLYQYTAQPSVLDKDSSGGPSYTQHVLQKHWYPLLLDPSTPSDKTYTIQQGITYCWTTTTVVTPVEHNKQELLVVVVYPDILFEGPRQYLQQWAQGLVQTTAREYQRYYQASAAAAANTSEPDDDTQEDWLGPDPQPFDKVFRLLLEQSKTQKQSTATTTAATTPQSTTTPAAASADNNNNNKANKKGKEKRQWHDGKAKVTKEAMEALDMSKQETPEEKQLAQERALQEARAAYLPTEQDLQDIDNNNNNDDNDETTQASSSTLANMFAHFTGNKVLEDADLDRPLAQMAELLQRKNVAAEIATALCQGVRLQLRGKKLTHGSRVVTAVRQALEHTVEQLLQQKPVDLLQNVVHKRGSNFNLFRSTTSSSSSAPYVIVVIGINGVGKSTSLAKLTYYLKQHGCSPLLVAGDTFRSGAVEQLGVHAKCLDVPIFSQGYAKDPSAVTRNAIQHATQNGHDVVLVDTAGRMQNNAPLMKALGKLVQENQPDFILLVCEALVGHDGLDQFKMFQQALGHQRKLDGLLLTKFDTVSDKVGAALTLTHETGAPIVFCGTGQKYHHLQKLQASSVIKALFS